MAPRDATDRYPATPLQQVMVLDSLREPGTGVNIQQVVFDLPEELALDRFGAACDALLRHNDALRSRFRIGSSDPGVTVDFPPPTQVPIQFFDWRGTAPARHQTLFDAFLEADRTTDFDLSAPPLLRVSVIQFSSDSYRVVCTYHHAILDGRSQAELIDQLMGLYEGYSERPASLDAPSFESFLSWLAERDPEASRVHWARDLAGYAGSELLSQLGPVPAANEKGHETVTVTWPAEAADALREFAARHEITPNSVIQGAWAILVSRLANVEDIVFGTVVAGRKGHIDGADATLGMFINTLPMRASTGGRTPVRELFRELMLRQRSHREHAHIAGRQIQSWIDLPTSSALFETVVIFEQKTVEQRLARLDSRWRGRHVEHSVMTGLPLNLAVNLDAEVEIILEFDRGRIDRRAAADLLPRFETLLHRILRDGDQPVGRLDLLDDDERERLFEIWQGPETQLPVPGVHLEVAARAMQAPDHVAVQHRGESLTYRELEERASSLAHRLRQAGVRPGERVAVAVPRSFGTVVAFLGVLKAGASYVPIDAGQPQERIRFLLEDAAPRLLLVGAEIEADCRQMELVSSGKLSCWAIEESSAAIPGSAAFQAVVPGSRDEAYLLYTSGSTGQPKGARIGHGGLSNHCTAMRTAFAMTARDRVPQFAPTHVDFAAEEIYPTLTAGGTLVLRDDDLPLTEFLPQAAEDGITLLNLPTAFWHEMVRGHDPVTRPWPATVRAVVVGGEKASSALLRKWREQLTHPIEWWNTYGPTEATITTTTYRLTVDPDDDQEIPIGRPIANVTHYVLDQALRPVPIGAVGELYIGGPGVALGYVERPELESERFVDDPFVPGDGRRLYATGDLVRYRDDGELLYVGRRDHQIKLRGFRIELEEIDAVLELHPGVRRAATAFHESAGSNGILVSFVETAAGETLDPDHLRSYVAERLPEASVPNSIVFRPRLPVLATGKIARSDLRLAPDELRRENELALRPRTPIEQRLQEIWSKVLGLEQVGIRDDFRELGGDSLLVVRMLLLVEQAFGRLPDANEFFRHPTIEAMAREIQAAESAPKRGTAEIRAALVPLQPAGVRPPIFCLRGANQYQHLADALGAEQPSFGIFLPEIESHLRNEHASLPTVEEIARASLRAIREHYPAQPFALAGFSFGGVVAYEMAQQMRAEGEEPLGLFLFDAILPCGEVFDRRRWFIEHLTRLSRGRLPGPLRRFAERIRGDGVVDAEPQIAALIRTIEKTLTRISDDYVPHMKPYAGAITLLRASRHDLRAGHFVAQDNGWGAWAQGPFEVIDVEGMHVEIIQPPHVARIAEAIAERLG